MIWAFIWLGCGTSFLTPKDKQLQEINKAIQSALNQYDEVLFGCKKVALDNKRLVRYATDDALHADLEVGKIMTAMSKTIGSQEELSTKLANTDSSTKYFARE